MMQLFLVSDRHILIQTDSYPQLLFWLKLTNCFQEWKHLKDFQVNTI